MKIELNLKLNSNYDLNSFKLLYEINFKILNLALYQDDELRKFRHDVVDRIVINQKGNTHVGVG